MPPRMLRPCPGLIEESYHASGPAVESHARRAAGGLRHRQRLFPCCRGREGGGPDHRYRHRAPGSNQSQQPQSSTTQPAEPDFADSAGNMLLAAAGNVLELLVPAAQAQGAANLDMNTPEIRAVTGSMQARFGQLKPYFDSGAVGLTADGHVDVRDANAVPLAERAKVKRLVAEENRDRDALYAEIAKAQRPPGVEERHPEHVRAPLDRARGPGHVLPGRRRRLEAEVTGEGGREPAYSFANAGAAVEHGKPRTRTSAPRPPS